MKVNRRNLNATLGSLGILFLGIFLIWFPRVFLNVPMPKNPLVSSMVDSIWLALAVVVMPYYWAVKRLGMSLADLGISKNKLGLNILLGCSLYTIALVVFLRCSDSPMIANHAVRHASPGAAFILTLSMALVAGMTDFQTRGFVLLTLSRSAGVVFAVIMQNLVWFTGHLHEIGLLTSCLGTARAVALTLTLGILGDVIVLRTKNVIGLSLAHVLLNFILVIYIRQM